MEQKSYGEGIPKAKGINAKSLEVPMLDCFRILNPNGASASSWDSHFSQAFLSAANSSGCSQKNSQANKHEGGVNALITSSSQHKTQAKPKLAT